MINFESPTSFCPIRSNLLYKYLFNGVQKLVYEWDEKNIQSNQFEPICISKHWEKFNLNVKFRKMDDLHSYFLDFSGPTYIKYDPERCKPTKINEGEIRFEFDIRGEPFEDLKILELILNQDDICNIPKRLQFEIFHQNSKQFITHDMKINKIIDSIDTGYVDTSEHLQTSLKKKLGKIKKLPIKHFKNVIKILNTLVGKIHIDSDDYTILNKSADSFWLKHKNGRIDMERKWFQPIMREILIKKFGENSIKEPETVRGAVDFKVYNIPIELKVFHEQNVPKKENKSGMTLLKEFLPQAFQYTIHTRCGFLIGYDYRKNIKTEFRRLSVAERVKIFIEGDKIIFALLFLGNILKPSSIK